MLTTRLCELLGITHPVVLGGMGIGTNPELVAAVSNAGALGIQGGCSGLPPADIAQLAERIRELSDRPFGLNMLLFAAGDADVGAVLDARPGTFSTAWPRADQDLAGLFARAHDAGSTVMHMVASPGEAHHAAEAGADVIVAQGTDGGGHVGLTGTIALVPMVVRAVAPVPVVAAGGLADGAGLASALMLGAEGALYGTRFLATDEAPVPDAYKRAITDSDGVNTMVTGLADVAIGTVWPGAYARVIRNRFIETWSGREGELRYQQGRVGAGAWRALSEGDADQSILYAGQSAGLIDSVQPAGVVVEQIVADAATLLGDRAQALVGSTEER
jgi:NAD(P)H-dependent flavin oxidoreductase YrpB (nitropropane dioxygenase family)